MKENPKGPEPTNCSCKSCNSKIFTEKGTEIVERPARKAAVTTWSCLKGHIQQTEETLLPDDWMDYVGVYGAFVPFPTSEWVQRSKEMLKNFYSSKPKSILAGQATIDAFKKAIDGEMGDL